MEERTYKVYIHEFPNEKVYIGITCQNVDIRWRKNGEGYCQQPYLCNVIKKYGWDNIIHDILEINLTLEDAWEAERYWISYCESNNPKYGYNIDSGGGTGKSLSEETKKKIAKGNKGKYISSETREKLRQNVIGTKNPMYGMCGELNPFYGKHHTEETRKILSEKTKGKYKGHNNPAAKQVVQLDLDGNYINTFSCIKEASVSTGVPDYIISRDCRKLTKKHTKYNFIWMYSEEYKGVVNTHEKTQYK